MAKPTPHTALEGMGFKLANKWSSGGNGKLGAVTHHYTMNSNVVGGGDTVDDIVKPIIHHVIVDEFSNKPGKYNAYYNVTQEGKPYSDGDYDMAFLNKDGMRSGSEDPIRDAMLHHRGVTGALSKEKAPLKVDVDSENLTRLTPRPYHLTPGWGEEDPRMKRMRYIRPGPDYQEDPMVRLNSAQDEPLDSEAHRVLTRSFNYMGRISPDDPDTDVYHVSYRDPHDPSMRYGFTVRHMPHATSEPVKDIRHRRLRQTPGSERDPLLPKPLIFSYDATHYPENTGDENSDNPVGKFVPVSVDDNTGEEKPVANFTRLGPLVERHHNIMRSVGLMPLPRRPGRPDWHFTAGTKKQAEEFDDIVNGNGAAGPCWSCGKATYNYPEGTPFRDDKSYPMTAEEETGGEMYGPDINMCGTCSQDHGAIQAARGYGSHGQGRLWSYKPDDHDDWENGEDAFNHREGSARTLMNKADEDLIL